MVRVEKMKNRIPFSQRLFWSIFVMFLGFTVCFLLFQYQREREFSQEKLNNVLSNYNYQLFSRTQQDTDINKTVRQFIEDIPQKELRVTIIDPNGKVLFDNSGTEEFNNHNDRSEVRKARLYNEGFAIRTSGSTGRRYFYSASNIGSYIYRSALPYDPYVQSALSTDKDFIYFMILMTLIFFFVLSRFTFSIGRTISKLRDFALNIEKDRIPENDYIFPNDELGDISKNIVTLYHRQQKAKDELSMEREKLIKHFQYAKEGFAMFTAEGKEILSNILFLDNSYEISINDISRQEEESRMKRQLTQNVAHELKTPVSSIQGYLETIISNPELTPDKRQFFLERCYSQSTRLTGLLRDISVLNRLDEASEMFDLSDINIPKLIVEIQKECSKEMDEKQITSEVILPGDPTIHGNYSLLYSIFRNLYDNAIAYAGEGSQITVNCYKEDPKFYYFSFADNGVGISEEHINRIFERFYRVDKGRSRKVGGTGLGLSIVKNGVNFHKGQISAKSSPGKGVTFFFTLKKKL